MHAVCFNLRHYPQNQNAAALVAGGAIGTPRYVTGRYHQDWLLLDTDWNWRLDAERQGQLRAVADIGSHWLDLTRYITGRDVVEVCADLHTFVTERNHPLGEVETFGAAAVSADVERVTQQMHSDDAAGLLLRYDDGLRGTFSVSQVSAGRKNTMEYEIDGSTSTLAWASEDPEHLWIGHRDRPTEVVAKDPGAIDPGRRRSRRLPGGPRGGLSRHVPRSVRRGLP